MIRFILLVILIGLIGCVTIQQDKPNLEIPSSPPVKVKTMEEQLSSLDPGDEKDEVVLIIGTDNDLFNGTINIEQYYISRAVMWANEIDPYIVGDFVVFVSHGYSHDNQWFCEYGPPYHYSVNYVVSDIRSKLGPLNTETPIVLIVCNEWQYKITHDANVYYGDYNIFLMPDSALEEDLINIRKESLMCGEVVIADFHNFIRSTNLQ